MKIIQMKTNHITNPMGYMMTKPVISYKVAGAKGTKQLSARVKVSLNETMTDVVYDSGSIAEIDSIAYTIPMELKPYTRYYWTVTVNTDAKETQESEVAWFETGKMNDAWTGRWICSDLNTGTQPSFFKNFSLKNKVKKARLYICGLGIYEAYINGEKVSDECLTPYCNAYDRWLQYQTYDVTDMLAKEEISLEVMLGDGWYKGRFGFNQQGEEGKGYYGDTLLLISELQLEYSDGSSETVVSDESWMAKKSKVQESSIYDGEIYDETFMEDTVYPVKIYEKEMARLTERLSLPIKVMETLKPIKLITSSKGETIIDLGQNHSGWFSLKVKEAKGTKVKLYFSEELQDGCFYNENLRTAKAEYTYICDGNEHTIRPHFTFYGYRYVMLEGFSNFKQEDYTALVLYSELDVTGNFTTGHELVNKLILNTQWGQKSNFLDVPTDCPQRDERMGWTADAQVFTPTACFNMDSYAFYTKFLYDMYEEQKNMNGAVPHVVPAFDVRQSCSVWGDAATIMPWVLYQFYGDKAILEAQYGSMKAWVDYIREFNGDDWKWRNIFHFGDWLALDSKNGSDVGGTDTGYIAHVYYYNSTLLVSKVAEILGNTKDAEVYSKRADELLAELRKEYFSEYGRACINTQTGYVTALKYGLSTDPARTAEDLKKELKMNNGNLATGFVGTPLLCNVLSDYGMDDLAYDLLVNEDYPGWLYCVKLGATTIWERWNSLDENGHFSSTGMNSLNHYANGSIIEWMYRHVAGINPIVENPGFREIKLIPMPGDALKKADASFDSPVGTYRSAWSIQEDDSVVFDVTIPFGGKAYLTLPYAPEEIYGQNENPIFKNVVKTETGYQCILESGSYHVEYMPTKIFGKTFSIESPLKDLMGDKKVKNLLLSMMPQLAQVPPSMMELNMLDLMKFAGQAIPQEQIDGINAALRAVK